MRKRIAVVIVALVVLLVANVPGTRADTIPGVASSGCVRDHTLWSGSMVGFAGFVIAFHLTIPDVESPGIDTVVQGAWLDSLGGSGPTVWWQGPQDRWLTGETGFTSGNLSPTLKVLLQPGSNAVSSYRLRATGTYGDCFIVDHVVVKRYVFTGGGGGGGGGIATPTPTPSGSTGVTPPPSADPSASPFPGWCWNDDILSGWLQVPCEQPTPSPSASAPAARTGWWYVDTEYGREWAYTWADDQWEGSTNSPWDDSALTVPAGVGEGYDVVILQAYIWPAYPDRDTYFSGTWAMEWQVTNGTSPDSTSCAGSALHAAGAVDIGVHPNDGGVDNGCGFAQPFDPGDRMWVGSGPGFSWYQKFSASSTDVYTGADGPTLWLLDYTPSITDDETMPWNAGGYPPDPDPSPSPSPSGSATPPPGWPTPSAEPPSGGLETNVEICWPGSAAYDKAACEEVKVYGAVPSPGEIQSGFDRLVEDMGEKVPFGYVAQVGGAIAAGLEDADAGSGPGSAEYGCFTLPRWTPEGTAETEACIPLQDMADDAAPFRGVMLVILTLMFAAGMFRVVKGYAAAGGE